MLLATATAVYCLQSADAPVVPERIYQGAGVRRVAHGGRHDVIALSEGRLVIVGEGELKRVDTGIEGTIHSLLILEENPLRVLLGAEPPQVYEYVAGSGKAQRSESFASLSCRDKWHTPWGGPAAVRSLAGTADGWIYADIHVGSIMRSPDGGKTWEPVTPTLNEDVHQVATCPAAAERVYANTARAVYVSYDRGASWVHRSTELGARYGRAVAVHPENPDCLLATVSNGPHGADVRGQLFRSQDAGETWQLVNEGFPAAVVHNLDTSHVAFDKTGTAWACVGRQLYVGRDDGQVWELVWEAPEPIIMVTGG